MTASRPLTPPSTTLLIDACLPAYDVVERHRTRVHASLPATYAAIKTTRLTDNTFVRALLFLRALPAAVLRGRNGLHDLANRKRDGRPTLAMLEANGFPVIAERPDDELVIGVEGQFWKLSGGRCATSAEAFKHPPAPGTARAAWNFLVRDIGGGVTELSTETRVLCADDGTRRRFLPYWAVIRAGSGLIRHAVLRDIRIAAER